MEDFAHLGSNISKDGGSSKDWEGKNGIEVKCEGRPNYRSSRPMRVCPPVWLITMKSNNLKQPPTNYSPMSTEITEVHHGHPLARGHIV